MIKKIITILLLIYFNNCYASSNAVLVISKNYKFLEILIIIIFISAYILIILEDTIKLKKSKPIIIAASLIWVIIAIIAKKQNVSEIVKESIQNNILDYSKLLLFLLVSMIYIDCMKEMKLFLKLKNVLINKNMSLKQIFWITGILTFFISPIADNLTTAILMCSIIITIEKNNKNFINLSCINIVIASNAGGSFSPFGDITTLMIWQAGILPFFSFFKIFIPALISYIIPAIFISTRIKNKILKKNIKIIKTDFGAKRLILLFILTIITTIIFETYLYIPAVFGMMTGLGYLKIFSYYIKIKTKKELNIIQKSKNIEWDTLLFFYGIILCVGGLSTIGYLKYLSNIIYNHNYLFIQNAAYQHTIPNIIIGLISAIIDNIPIMFAILLINPNMNEGQWLLICLTIGIGGNLLSIGSAAGIALMGVSKYYNFLSHIKYTWIILIGYLIAIIIHILINKSCFY